MTDTANAPERIWAYDDGAHVMAFDYETDIGGAREYVLATHCDELVEVARAEGALGAQAKIARLTEALEFYADDNRTGLPSDGPWGLGSNDFGSRARAALQENAHG